MPSGVLLRVFDWTKNGALGLNFGTEVRQEINRRIRENTLSSKHVGEYLAIEMSRVPLLNAIRVPQRWVRGRPLAVLLDTEQITDPFVRGLKGQVEIHASGRSRTLNGQGLLGTNFSLGRQFRGTTSPMTCEIPESVSWPPLQLGIRYTGVVKGHADSTPASFTLGEQASYAIQLVDSISDLLPPSASDETPTLAHGWSIQEVDGGLLCTLPNQPSLAGVAIGMRIELCQGDSVIAAGHAYLPNTPVIGSSLFVPLRRLPSPEAPKTFFPSPWKWVMSSDDDAALLGTLDGCTARWVGSFSKRMLLPPSDSYLSSLAERSAWEQQPDAKFNQSGPAQ